MHDAVGNINLYLTGSGNIGLGAGFGLDFGTITPKRSNQFLNTDFAGNGASYNANISTPFIGAGYSKGGSVSGDFQMNYHNFGMNERGYTISQPSIAPKGKFGFGATYSSSMTGVY